MRVEYHMYVIVQGNEVSEFEGSLIPIDVSSFDWDSLHWASEEESLLVCHYEDDFATLPDGAYEKYGLLEMSAHKDQWTGEVDVSHEIITETLRHVELRHREEFGSFMGMWTSDLPESLFSKPEDFIPTMIPFEIAIKENDDA